MYSFTVPREDSSFSDSNNSKNSSPPEYQICRELEKTLNKAGDIENKADIIVDFWKNHREKHSCFIEEIITKLKDEANQQGSPYALGWCYIIFGWIELERNPHGKSISYFTDAHKQFKACNNISAQIEAINWKAVAYTILGRYDKALDKYLVALELVEKIGDKESEGHTCSNMGHLLIHLNQPDQAIEYLKRSLILSESSLTDRAINYSNLGVAHRLTGNYKEAAECQVKCLELCEKENFISTKIFALLEMGFIREIEGNLTEAKRLFTQCRELSVEINLPRAQARAIMQLGRLDKVDGDLESAMELLKEAQQILHSVKVRKYEAQVLYEISEVFYALGDYKNAFTSFKQCRGIEKEVFNDETINQIGVLKVQQTRKEAQIFKDLYNQINTISQIGQAITSSFDIKEITNITYEHVRDLIETDVFAVGIYQEDKGEILYKIAIEDGKILPEFSAPIKQTNLLAARCINSKDDIVINDISDKSKWPFDVIEYKVSPARQVKSVIYSPLIVQSKIVGVITVQSYQKNVYQPHHVDILRALGAYIAIALENGKLFEHVQELATRDSLTGIPNRRNILTLVGNELFRYLRYREPFSIILVDLDNYKSVNDHFGHKIGDLVLQGFTDICSKIIRDVDKIGRIGGEEFLILLPNTKNDKAALMAERLRCAIEAHNFYPDEEARLSITASFGVAEVNNNNKNIDDIMNRADIALFEAKAAGKNQVRKA